MATIDRDRAAAEADLSALKDAIGLALGYGGSATVSLRALAADSCLSPARCEELMGRLEQSGGPWLVERAGGSGLGVRWTIRTGDANQ